MGRKTLVATSLIVPSQDYVKEGTIGYIIGCLEREEYEALPPTPVVRMHPDGKRYVAIDGHNLIVMRHIRNEEIEVYVADAADDALEGITGSEDAIAERKSDLAEKYDWVLAEINRLEKERISSFDDLQAKYDYLSSYDALKAHFAKE